MLSFDRIGETQLDSWKALVDIGDLVAVVGEVISSKRGELSVMADSWHMAAKALRPLPNPHTPLSEETRVRQRYADLIMRDTARTVARLRPATMTSLRASFAKRDYLEVETPMLQTMHGGAAARPFVTSSNAFDMQLFLRIAPELFLKRCVVGGIERVFEINRNFRNEGADSTHSPEFAMLEFYQAYADYHDMATLTRELIQEAALAVHGTLNYELVDGGTRDLSGDWDQISVYPSVSKAIGQEISPETSIETLRKLCALAGITHDPKAIHGKLVEELLEHYVVEHLKRPTFVMDYPVDTSPLVRENRTTKSTAEKWDLYIDGYEAGTGYSELVDPVIQRERLVEQSSLKAGGDAEAMQLDEDFLRALEYGMPPCGGVGMGIDRLLMTLTGLNIRETILFPLVKPE
jgi:lysyl-tRNA synthetase class 2